MSTVSGLSGSNVPVRTGDTAATVTRVAATSSAAPRSTETLTAKQGAEAVGKASENATKAFTALASLREELSAATKPGSVLSKDEAKAFNDRIAEVKGQIDRLAADAKVGGTNLLSKQTVSVASGSGEKVSVTGKALDSKALGLGEIDVTDVDSLRKAVGKIALATGQTQTSVFNLQAASGVLTPTATNPGIEAFEKIRASRSATPAAGSTAASVEKALSNQAAANASSYGRTGSASSTLRPGSILNLFA